jgi:2C-methyl-D-erythritol 2,4-cyclodiphosphate synthase
MSTNELNINDLLTHFQANGWNINDFQKYLEDNQWHINDLQKYLDVLLEHFQAYNWDINDLQIHLQAAVDLEFWTIPFYMSAMYSIKDQSCEAYRLIQSVVNQEMLHLQLAANIANAYGCSPKIRVFPYEETEIPHLNFEIDTPDPRNDFSPYSAAIGPLDEERINSMCLIEYPESKTGHIPNLKSDITQYGSIGEFYDALEVGIIIELIKEGHPTYGGSNQISVFERLYQNFTQQTITENGEEGVKQAHNIINAIRDQGEGGKSDKIPTKYQNTVDYFYPDLPHFQKFMKIQEIELPETYYGEANPDHESGKEAQRILIHNFSTFMHTLETMFCTGEVPHDFDSKMYTIGDNILHCWKEGAIPKFYEKTPDQLHVLLAKM